MVGILDFQIFCENNFSSCIDSIKNCSFDQINNCFLSLLNSQCFNFDKIKEIVCFGRKSLCSVDSLFFSKINNTIYFVEFKNCRYKNAKSNFICSAQDSYLIYTYLLNFCTNSSANPPLLKAVLVINEKENASFLAKLKAAKISNRLDSDSAYSSLKNVLVNQRLYNTVFLFDEVIICSPKELKNILKIK